MTRSELSWKLPKFRGVGQKFDQPLGKGPHLLMVRITTYQNQVFYTGLKEIKDPKAIQALNEDA